MFANSDKFQATVVHHNKDINQNYPLQVNNFEIETKNSVKLLGIETDIKLRFDEHIAPSCKKAANQLCAKCRLQNQIGKKEKEILMNSFVYSNFNYCPLVSYFCSKKQNLFVQSRKTAAFGEKSLKTLGPQIWSSLPEKIKSATNLVDCKNLIKKRFSPKCMSNLCSFKNKNVENWP